MKSVLLIAVLASLPACGGSTEANLKFDNIIADNQADEILTYAILDWERDFGKISDNCKQDLNKISIIEYETDCKIAVACGAKNPVLGCLLKGRIDDSKYKMIVSSSNVRNRRYSIYRFFARWAVTCEGEKFMKDKHRDWVKHRYLR